MRPTWHVLAGQLALTGGSSGGVHVGPVVGIAIVVAIVIAGALIIITRRER